jgi:hypothetical protein
MRGRCRSWVKSGLGGPKVHFRYAPESRLNADNAGCPKSARNGSGGFLLRKEKAARRRLFNSNLMIVDQAAINAGPDFRPYAIKPMPAKPKISIAHVEGSGTAAAKSNTAV